MPTVTPFKRVVDSRFGNNCFHMSYEKARVRAGFINGSWVLDVDLWKIMSNIQVILEPVMYIDQPDWWRIKVIGCYVGDVGATVMQPHTASLWLATADEKSGWISFIGKRGIEIEGAEGKVEQIKKEDFGK